MLKRVLIWGASGHSRVVAEIVRLQGDLEIIGFLDDVNVDQWGMSFCGSTILGGREQLENLSPTEVGVVPAFGDCSARLKVAAFAQNLGFRLVSIVHPRAFVSESAEIGDGTVLVAGAVVNADAKIGDCVIVNTSATVDHGCVIEDGVHISPGAHLASDVRVGRGVWIGIGSTVIEKLSIGEYTFIGAGSVVIRDIPANVRVFGVPATVRGFIV